MRRWPVVLSVLILAGTAGCAVSTPFAGPGLAPAVQARAEVVLSITHVTLSPDRTQHAAFWRSIGKIDAVLPSQPGLIAHAKRRELLGDEAWTVTAWRDEESLRAFVQSEVHTEAMATAANSFIDARFARVAVPAERLPLPWREVLAILERGARHYYE